MAGAHQPALAHAILARPGVGDDAAPARFDGQGVAAYTDPTGPTANAGTGRRGDDDLPDVTLGTPVFNWDEIVKETAAAR